MDILKAVVVAIIGGLFGAWVTAIRAKWSAFSSDYSKRLEQAFTLIDRLAECSCIWWVKVEPSDNLKVSPSYIIGLKAQLATLIESIDQDYRGFNSVEVKRAYHSFVNACTGGEFPDKREQADSAQAVAILKYAELLKAQIFAVRRRDYSMRMEIDKRSR